MKFIFNYIYHLNLTVISPFGLVISETVIQRRKVQSVRVNVSVKVNVRVSHCWVSSLLCNHCQRWCCVKVCGWPQGQLQTGSSWRWKEMQRKCNEHNWIHPNGFQPLCIKKCVCVCVLRWLGEGHYKPLNPYSYDAKKKQTNSAE